MWDTVRADRLGSMGYDKATTPDFDRLTRDATLFRNVVSTSCWTVPSHASLFTGLLPSAHGAVGEDGWLADAHQTLAETLSEAGYDTFFFSANPFISAAHNFTQGFDWVAHPWEDPWRDKLRPDNKVSKAQPGRRVQRRFKEAGPVINEAFLSWIEERSGTEDGPFFAFLNYMEAHFPWHSSRAQRLSFMPPGLVRHSFRMTHDYNARMDHLFGVEKLPELDLQAVNGLYDTSLRKLDRITGRLIAELSARGIADDTVIVVVSDHGEMLGEHDLVGHEYALYEELIRVPVLIRYPPQFEPGARIDVPAQIHDVHRSILELTGLWPEGANGSTGASRSLLTPQRIEPDRPLLAEYIAPKRGHLDHVLSRHPGAVEEEHWLRPLRALTIGPWKLIRYDDGETHLFHLAQDPEEGQDVASEYPKRVDSMSRRLRTMVEALEQRRPEPAPGEKPSGEAGQDHLDRLKSLGYVTSGDPASED
jgi:arylsulfatase A-like enzyme